MFYPLIDFHTLADIAPECGTHPDHIGELLTRHGGMSRLDAVTRWIGHDNDNGTDDGMGTFASVVHYSRAEVALLALADAMDRMDATGTDSARLLRAHYYNALDSDQFQSAGELAALSITAPARAMGRVLGIWRETMTSARGRSYRHAFIVSDERGFWYPGELCDETEAHAQFDQWARENIPECSREGCAGCEDCTY